MKKKFLSLLLILDNVPDLYLFDPNTKDMWTPFSLMKFAKDFDEKAEALNGWFELDVDHSIIFCNGYIKEQVLAAVIFKLRADNT